MRALVDYAFENRKAERIIANIFVGNTASKNVVEKLGFKLEGIQRRVVMAR
jgi:RimJ/RimL family protein N-acetyltransferase